MSFKSLAYLTLASSLFLSAQAFASAAPIQSNNGVKSAVGTTGNTKAPATSASKSKTAVKKTELAPVLSDEAKRTIEESAQKLTPETRKELNSLSDAIHLEDRAIFNELRDDEELSLSDIGMLWQAAVERSGTIRYAIEKLSRKDATGKPVEGDSFSKRMLQNLVHLSGVAGSMWTGTPAGLIGSGMVQDIMSGNPQESALSRVTDADMVILAKEVESLQTDLIRLYYAYKNAKERLELSQEATSTITRYYDRTTESPNSLDPALQPLMQTLFETTRQDQQNMQQAYNSAKTALTLVVGLEAMAALEQPQDKRKSASN